MNFLTEYEKLSSEEYGDCFVGMNSGRGFVGTYEKEIIEEKLKRLYIIKGAAGTGKSSFMKRIYNDAMKCGIECRRLACSSDHNSLDCVILNSSVAVLDGTSPHAVEMKYPGAVSELIDVSKFWDNNRLRACRDEIIYYTDNKKRLYDEAYLGLKAYSILQSERASVVMETVKCDKLDAFVNRFVKALGNTTCESYDRDIICRAVGMRGKVRLDSLERAAERIIKVNDIYGTVYIFMNKVSAEMRKLGVGHVRSHDPILPELICDIYLPDKKTLITAENVDVPDRIVNMNRFIDTEKLSDRRGALRLSVKCTDLLMNDILESLGEAGRSHFSLEKIYGDAMNFDCLSSYFDIKSKEIIESVQDGKVKKS